MADNSMQETIRNVLNIRKWATHICGRVEVVTATCKQLTERSCNVQLAARGAGAFFGAPVLKLPQLPPSQRKDSSSASMAATGDRT